MKYIRIGDATLVPLKIIKANQPNTSFPSVLTDEILNPIGFAIVHEVEKPVGDVVSEGDPVLDEITGKWYQTWEVRDFTPDEVADNLEAERQEMVITKRQGRQQIIIMGLLDAVQTAINSITDPVQRALIQSYWDDSTEYRRTHQSMIDLAPAVGISDTELDQAFRDAALLD
jgi:hypothetical protein